MSTGRCAGCGRLGKASEVSEHTRDCASYKHLFMTSPERALEPEAEFLRWRAAERPAERAERIRLAVDEADRRRRVQACRWATPADILEET